MNKVKEYIQAIIAEKHMLGSLIGLWLLALGVIVLSLIFMPTSDHRIVTQYTLFGESHFYRERWWYLVSFPIMTLITAVLHTLLGARVARLGQASLGRMIVLAGCSVIVVAAIIILRLFRLES